MSVSPLQESVYLSHAVWSGMTDSEIDPSAVSSVIQEILESSPFTRATGLNPGFSSFQETLEIARLEPSSFNSDALNLLETIAFEIDLTNNELGHSEEPFDFEIPTLAGEDVNQEILDGLEFLSHHFTEGRLFPLASFRKTLEKAQAEDSFNPQALTLLEMIAFEIDLAKLGTSEQPFDFLIRALSDSQVTDEELDNLQSILNSFTQKRLQTADPAIC